MSDLLQKTLLRINIMRNYLTPYPCIDLCLHLPDCFQKGFWGNSLSFDNSDFIHRLLTWLLLVTWNFGYNLRKVLLLAVALAWLFVRGCWWRTAAFACVWPAGTCSELKPPARLFWPLTMTPVSTCCSWMWALCSLCWLLQRKSKPGWDTETLHVCFKVFILFKADLWIFPNRYNKIDFLYLNAGIMPNPQVNVKALFTGLFSR